MLNCNFRGHLMYVWFLLVVTFLHKSNKNKTLKSDQNLETPIMKIIIERNTQEITSLALFK